MTTKRWFWLAVALQVVLLLGMVGRHEYTLTTGRTVRLETAPLDPWSMFRGQYIQLSYKISQLREGEVSLINSPYKPGQQVWVTLRQGDPFWTAVAVHDYKPPVGPDEVPIRGTVQWSTPAGENRPFEMQVRYGIEQFYVPEGEGPKLEQNRQGLSVEVKVDAFGRGAISRVFADGKEVRFQ